MDAQIERTHGHHYDQDPLHSHSAAVEGEGDHHEKISVLKKVKAKAKKIKNTLGIKAHGQHGHDEHEHDHDNNDEEDEYEEDEEEIVQDPDIHGAPMYESAAAKNFVAGQGDTGVQPRTNLGPTSQLGQGQTQNVCPGTFQSKVTEPGVPAKPMNDSGVKRNVGTDHNVNPGQFRGTSGQKDYSADTSPTNYQTKGSDFGKGVESAAPRYDTEQGDSAGQFKGALGKPLDVDQNAPKNRPQDVSPANYGTKATNPAGTSTEEAGVAPILKSFDKMDISDESQPKKGATTGSHDRNSPTSDWSSDKTSTTPGNTPVPESFDASTENHPQDMNVDERAKQQGGYMGTVSSVPSAISAAKKEPTTTGSHDQFSPTSDRSSDKTSTIPGNTPVPEGFNTSTENHPQDINVDEPAKPQSGYTGTISSVASTIAAAKNVVASKIGYGGTNDNVTGSQMNKEGEDTVSAGVPMDSESVRGPATQQSSYTDKIASATSAITGRAVSAKNVVASKLGYGESNNPSSPTASEISKGTSTSPTAAEMNKGGENAQSGGVTGYGRHIGTGTNKNAGTDSDTHTITGSDMDRGAGVPVGTGSGVGGPTDKGAGMKGYIAEKLKPGEEDKALSELISGALPKRGKGVVDGEEKRAMGQIGVDDGEKRAMGEVVSDAYHKRDNDDEMKIENKPMGKVTESEEVANRLGSTESEKLGQVPTSETSPRTGVVDKVKGALTNWFGKGGETNPSQAFNDQSPSDASGKQDISTLGSNNDSQDGERRLQESTN